MKAYVLIFSLFLSLFSFSTQAATAVQNNAAPQSANLTAAQKADGEIIETVMVLNTNEINAAKEASAKASAASVKKFAHQMQRDHGKNLFDFKRLSRQIKSAPLASDKSNSLQQEGKNELEKLKSTDKKDFDTAYMDAMVKGHEAALSLIDDSIKHASNPDLVKHLNATRKTVEHHLEMAKEAQNKLVNKK